MLALSADGKRSVCLCLQRAENLRFQGYIIPWGSRGIEQMMTDSGQQSGVKRKKDVCVWGKHPSSCLFVSACEHPPLCERVAVSVCVCGVCVCVCVCVSVCAHSAKWNGRYYGEYNRGPTEVATRHNSSLPLTLTLDNGYLQNLYICTLATMQFTKIKVALGQD